MIAICIGHSRPGDDGAASADGTSEWAFNQDVGERVVSVLAARCVAAKLYDTYEGGSYAAAMLWLASALADDHAKAALELHFNAANGHAKGCEWLFWNGSVRGRALASELRTAHRGVFPDQVDRGLKPRGSGDRGALFLRWTTCPAVICEPFFGDNPDEWSVFGTDAGRARLATAVADGILRWFKPA